MVVASNKNCLPQREVCSRNFHFYYDLDPVNFQIFMGSRPALLSHLSFGMDAYLGSTVHTLRVDHTSSIFLIACGFCCWSTCH